ncbi:MAG: hypothetical protein JSR54_19975, partial [Proteobacteria bacterium]|nr:hypothetical protein [Pseudomonadota bacterium]
MSPLSRLFGKPPTLPPTLAERIAALASAPADVVAAAALGDGEAALRAAAIAQLADGTPLRDLAGCGEALADSGPRVPAAL